MDESGDQGESYQESEAVKRLMRLMSDRANKSPIQETSRDDADRYSKYLSHGHTYKLERNHQISRALGQRDENSSSSDNMLRRAEKMRKEVETTLDSVRRNRAVQSDVDPKTLIPSDARHRYIERSSLQEIGHKFNGSTEKYRSGTSSWF